MLCRGFCLLLPLLSDPYLLDKERLMLHFGRKEECSSRGEVRDQALGFESQQWMSGLPPTTPAA